MIGISQLINNQLFEAVHPCLVRKKSYIGNVNGVMNAIILEGKPIGENILQGEGAGPGPTSSSLLADLLSILREDVRNPFGISSKKRKKILPTGFIVGLKNIYLSTNIGRLLVIDIKSGKTISTLKIDKDKISRPFVSNQNLYLAKDNAIIKLN